MTVPIYRVKTNLLDLLRPFGVGDTCDYITFLRSVSRYMYHKRLHNPDNMVQLLLRDDPIGKILNVASCNASYIRIILPRFVTQIPGLFVGLETVQTGVQLEPAREGGVKRKNDGDDDDGVAAKRTTTEENVNPDDVVEDLSDEVTDSEDPPATLSDCETDAEHEVKSSDGSPPHSLLNDDAKYPNGLVSCDNIRANPVFRVKPELLDLLRPFGAGQGEMCDYITLLRSLSRYLYLKMLYNPDNMRELVLGGDPMGIVLNVGNCNVSELRSVLPRFLAPMSGLIAATPPRETVVEPDESSDSEDLPDTLSDSETEYDVESSVGSPFLNPSDDDIEVEPDTRFLRQDCSICDERSVNACLSHGNNGHMFCFKCAHDWAKINKLCPICRAPIEKVVQLY